MATGLAAAAFAKPFDRIVEPALDGTRRTDDLATRRGCKLFVSGLHASLGDDVAAQDSALRAYYHDAGLTVASTAGLGKAKRFGFVSFLSADDASAALALPTTASSAANVWCPFASAERAVRNKPPKAVRTDEAVEPHPSAVALTALLCEHGGGDVALLVHASHAARVNAYLRAPSVEAKIGARVACARAAPPLVGRAQFFEILLLRCCRDDEEARADDDDDNTAALDVGRALIDDELIAFIAMPLVLLRGRAAGPFPTLRAATEALHAAALASRALTAGAEPPPQIGGRGGSHESSPPPPQSSPQSPPPPRVLRLQTVPPALAGQVADALDDAAAGRCA